MATAKNRSAPSAVQIYALPWSVRRGIVAQYRTDPPGGLRAATRDLAERLSRVPPAVWALPIDWRARAHELDHAALVRAVARTPEQERRAHAAIVGSLRRAAQQLNKQKGQLDPMLAGTFGGLARQAPRLAPYLTPKQWPSRSADAPRLSELLRELASWIAGEKQLTHGLHGASMFAQPQRVGADGAALVASKRVATFFQKYTGAPQNARVREVVMAYHPNAKDRDRARGRRARGKSQHA